jgi:hypothetical protein
MGAQPLHQNFKPYYLLKSLQLKPIMSPSLERIWTAELYHRQNPGYTATQKGKTIYAFVNTISLFLSNPR